MRKSQKKKIKIGIFGFGIMGKAVFNLLKKQNSAEFFIFSIDADKVAGAICLNNLEALINKCDIIFLCVKPQDYYALTPIKKDSSKILISIMAGVSINNIKKIINSNKIIRTMPNIALLVGESVIGWYVKKNNFKPKELAMVENLFSRFGKPFRLGKEDKLNAITAISGSGPAYLFLFFEALMKSAVKLGFNKKEAREIVFMTIIGSMYYMNSRENRNIDVEELIRRVKSKKGTTEAALDELNIDNFYSLWQKSTQKAYLRAKKISSHKIK